MKSTALVAAGIWLGVASAGVHKLKLQKIPLAEQLVRKLTRIMSKEKVV